MIESQFVMKVVNVTEQDQKTFREIRKCGFLGVDIHHGPFLTNGFKVTQYRIKRLHVLGLIEPIENTLFKNAPTQQYIPAKKEAA